MIQAAEYLFQFLASRDITHIFMLSGGGCMYLCDALGRSTLKYTCCLHEQAVTIAALAYAQYSGKPGAALVTSGPGATNAITGVMAAWTESVPLVVISGQVKTDDFARIHGVRSRGVQEAPIIDMVKPVTKYAVLVEDPNDIRYHLEKALFLAADKRPGPVWLDIPLNVQSAEVDERRLRSFLPEPEPPAGMSAHARKIMEMLGAAKRPVILAGYGIRLAQCAGSFLQWAEQLNIPVLTTWKAADLMPDTHPLFMGRPGIAGQRAANFIQQNADLLMVMGARLDFPQTGFNQRLFAREAKKIIIDVDPAELRKFPFTVDYPVCASLSSLLDHLQKLEPPPAPRAWLSQCAAWRERYALVLPEQYQKKDSVDLYVLIEQLSALLSPDDVIVPGSSGMGSDVSYQIMRIKAGQRMLNSPGLGSMGFGIPSALGACIASGQKRTVCVNGDGGFQMNIQELETVRSLGLPVKFIVLNNEGYASIRNTQRTYFKGFYVGSSAESGVSLPKVSKIARAYGFPVFSITRNNEIKDTLTRLLETGGPAFCEVMMDAGDTLSLKASSYIQRDGTAISAPVEDLYPFLPRKEFYQNMYIKPVNKTGINLCAILFDIDTTLIDRKAGILAPEKRALTADGAPCADGGIIGRADGASDGELYPGVEALLKGLSKEYDLYALTSEWRGTAVKALSHHGIERHFKEIKGAETGLEGSTKARMTRMIEELLDKRKITRENTVMVGGSAEDIQAAAAHGIQTVALNYGHASAGGLKDALLTADSAAALSDILR